MSFSLTTAQIRAQTKDVTRRAGWLDLEVGEQLQACEKVMGLRGKPLVRICVIEVVDFRRETLNQMTIFPAYGATEVKREGFPLMTPAGFVQFFCQSHKPLLSHELISRIEFRYV